MVSCYARRLLALLLLIITPTCAPVQRAEKESAPVLIALRAARLLDVRSGRLITDPVVIIEGERIKAVGSLADGLRSEERRVGKECRSRWAAERARIK